MTSSAQNLRDQLSELFSPRAFTCLHAVSQKPSQNLRKLNLKTEVEDICDVVHAGIDYVPSMNQICLGKVAMFREGRAVTST